MPDKFLKEIPGKRIELGIAVEKSGKKEKVELPFKMLALGDFTGKKQDVYKQSSGTVNLDGGGQGLLDKVKKKKKHRVTADTLEPVMKTLQPKLNFPVENKITGKGSINVDLDITSMDSFRPETIVKNTPELSRLLAVRNLLKELKSTMVDNKAFKSRLEEVMKDPERAKALQKELRKIVPEGK